MCWWYYTVEGRFILKDTLYEIGIWNVCMARGGFGGGGSRGSGPPLSYMKNDVMHTVIYGAFCMLPSLDLQACKSF